MHLLRLIEKYAASTHSHKLRCNGEQKKKKTIIKQNNKIMNPGKKNKQLMAINQIKMNAVTAKDRVSDTKHQNTN